MTAPASGAAGTTERIGDATDGVTGAPVVSVVTAAYNMERYVLPTVESVLGQSLDALEMIVVDDGSSDRTAEIVATVHDPRLRLIRTPNGGVSAARNLGLEACRAPLVLFLDADDLLAPEALERMAACLAARPEAVACFAHHVKIDEDGNPVGGDRPSALKRLPEGDTLRHLIAKNVIVNGGALCIRTEVARAVGGYDARLRYSEDWEFWCRLAARGDFVALPDLIALRYRVRSAGANTTLAGTPFRPNLEAIDVVYRMPALTHRFPVAEVRRSRRRMEANVHWSGARSALGDRRFGRFLAYLLVGLVRYPGSVLQWRLVYLFFKGLPLSPHGARKA